jgi:ABC-type nickel/cobalt efflux system permease component RcnA
VLGLAIPDRLATVLELAVGCLLLALGADVVRRVWREPLHVHVHRHGDVVHAHLHRHAPANPHDAAAHGHGHPGPLGMRAALVGSVQGLAGSGALIVLLAQSVRTPLAGLGTLLAFGLGSVLGMAALSLCIALPIRLASEQRLALPRHVTLAAGLVSIVVGAVVVTRWALALPVV